MQKISLKQKFGLILLGVILCLFFLEIGMRLWEGTLLFMQEQKNKVSASALKKGEYRILCFGESTTVWGGDNSWPAQLERLLNQKNIGIKFKVINKGRYSIQTPYIISIAGEAINQYHPDMVISMMGINDGDNTVPYEQGDDASQSFISHLKIYKLAKLLWLHSTHKSEELRNDKLKNEKVNQKKTNIENGQDEVACMELGRKRKDQRKFFEAGESFKMALGINPRNDDALIELSRCYIEQGNYTDAMEMINRAREINPKNIWVYIELGNCYRNLGRFLDAEKTYQEALGLDPVNPEAFMYLGLCYKASGQYDKAEEMFKKAIELSTNDAQIQGLSYIFLGNCYRDQLKYDASDKILKQAIEVNPKNWEAYAELILNQRELNGHVDDATADRLLEPGCDNNWAYKQMGWYYLEKGRPQDAQKMFEKALAVDPADSVTYIELGGIYSKLKETKKEGALFKKAEELTRGNDRICGRLAVYYLEHGDPVATKKYFQEAERIRRRYYPLLTRNNYQKLQQSVAEKGLKFVCVQYPMRSLEPLKKLFDSTDGIIFVDNEKAFKAAIKQGRYGDYFEDCFAGDFGHGTPKGNKLLAENIMHEILKQVFNR